MAASPARLVSGSPLVRRALRSTCGAVAILAAIVAVPAAHAAVPAPLVALSKALATVKSYQVDLVVSTTGATASSLRGKLIVVRKGTTNQVYFTFSTKTAKGTTTIDAIIVGTRVCVRTSATHSAYQCLTNPQLAKQFNLDPSQSFTKTGVSLSSTPTSSKMVNGQTCDGYSFTSKTATAQASGTLYIARGTNLPCEEDATGSASTGTTGSASAKTTAIWSHFNDPNLTVPAVH